MPPPEQLDFLTTGPRGSVTVRQHEGGVTVPATSREAYRAVEPHVGERQCEVLDALRQLGPSTIEEVARHLGRLPHEVSGRFGAELARMGRIRRTGQRRATRSGALAEVWEACG